jgi:segregation and condensation protein A
MASRAGCAATRIGPPTIPPVSYEVRTPVFEGPLDLLLQLITSHRLEVTELRLADLVSEYLAHVELMRSLDLEVTSEFLVIAATLIQLKARSLLPGSADIELDEELLLSEERDRLLARLLANLTFKDVAAVFGHRLDAADLLVPREAGPDVDQGPPVAAGDLPVDASGLASIASRVLALRRAEPDLDHLDLDLPSVTEAMQDIRARLERDLQTDFDRLTAHLERPMDVVAYFLAVLELARWGLVRARQSGHLEPITVERTETDATRVVSEFDDVRGGRDDG